jgi:hypothetical protein
MIKKIVGEYSLANAKRKVRFAGNFDVYFGKQLTDIDETSASLLRR